MDTFELAQEFIDRSMDAGWRDDSAIGYRRELIFHAPITGELATLIAQAILLYDTPYAGHHRALELGNHELDATGRRLRITLRAEWRIPATTTPEANQYSYEFS